MSRESLESVFNPASYVPGVDADGWNTTVNLGSGFEVGLDDIPIIGPIKQLFEGGPAGATSGVQMAADITTLVLDLAGTLSSFGLGILISTFQPLQELIKCVTGDSSSLNAGADSWVALSDSEISLAKAVLAAGEGLAAWTGDAADACRTWVTEVGDLIGLISQEATVIAGMLANSAALMDSTRSFVNNMLGILIMESSITMAAAAASAPISFGASIGIAIGVIAVQVTFCLIQITQLIEQCEAQQVQIGAQFDRCAPNF